MLHLPTLTTARVLDVFTEEVAARGGLITDTFHDGQRLFTRSVLPHVDEVRPSDRFQGGVALKATRDGVWLYPYLFRQICRTKPEPVSGDQSEALIGGSSDLDRDGGHALQRHERFLFTFWKGSDCST